MTIEATELESWTTEVLQKWGYAPDDARYVAGTLIDADLRGVDSHGVIRLAAYEARIAAGLVDPTAAPAVERDGATVRVDATGVTGQVAARVAVDEIDALSSQHGVASAAVRGSAHFGAAGYYARDLARRGKVAIVVSNSDSAVVPFGGREALLGTNPIAFAAPTGGDPLSLDMATSTSAMGKVILAQARGTRIPVDWGIDGDGHPTTDPDAVTALLPAAGPKGYGLGFLVEILAGVLSGAAVARDIGNMNTDFSRPQDVGHWMLALDVAHFLPLDAFRGRIDGLIALAHAVAPAPGHDAVLVPGEPEERTRARRSVDGIPLADATVAELTTLGTGIGLAFPSAVRS